MVAFDIKRVVFLSFDLPFTLFTLPQCRRNMNPIRLFDATLYVVVFTVLGAHAGVIVNTTITQGNYLGHLLRLLRLYKVHTVTDPTTANHNTSTLKDLLDIKCMLNGT